MTRWRDIPSALTEVTPPAVEPLSVAEVKHRLRIEDTADDADLQLLILTARRTVESKTGLTLVPTVHALTFDRFPCDRVIPLPRAPLVSVASVKSYDEDNVEATLASASYFVDTASKPGRVCLASGANWPTSLREHNAGVIQFTAGFGGTAKSITSITRSSATATVTTGAAHGYATGQRITIAGSDMAAYNGTFEITVTGATTFTFTVTGTPTSPATGTMTATSLGIPETYLLAMLVCIGFWYRHRDEFEKDGDNVLPMGFGSLIADRQYAFG